jgi:serine/threonine protein kinase
VGSSTQSLVGQTIADRYHVLSLIGEGGMGRVYLAEHVKMGRKSAVKVLSPELAFSAEAISRFHREAANASRINHPNVAAIYDFGETSDGLLYLAMEFVEGESLRTMLMREPRLDVLRSAKLIRQAADALAAAHHLGIVHRDLKPDNIMVTRNLDGTDLVKVVDFGIAKTVDEGSGSQTLTTAGVSIGTPEYMSPEQLAGEKLDARTDVYSLAVVLFNILSGTLPYPRLTSRETLVKRLTSQPRRLRDVAPDIDWPADLQRALDRALAPYIEDRYSNVTEFGLDVLAAAMSMHNQRTVRLGTPTAEAETRRIAAENEARGGRPMVGTLILIMALGTLLIRAEPIGRDTTRIASTVAAPVPLVVPADSQAHDSIAATTPPADSAGLSNALDPKLGENPQHLTSDSTVAQAGTPLKIAEHDSLKSVVADSMKLVMHDSVKPVVRDSIKPVVHDSLKTPKRDSSKTVQRDSSTVARKTTLRDSISHKTQPRDSVTAHKTPQRDSATAIRKTVRPSEPATVDHPAPSPDDTATVQRPHRLLGSNGDTAAALGAMTKDDSTRAAAEDVRGHFEKARALMLDGRPAEAQLELRDAAIELRALRSRLDTAGTRQLDMALRRLRQRSYEACVAARDRTADSTAAARYQCERIVARPGILSRPGRAGQQ